MQHPKSWLPALTLAASFLLIANATTVWADDSTAVSASTHIVNAETALHAGEYRTAATEYRLAAESSNRVEVAAQATRIAYSFELNEDALLAAQRWQELAPASDEALLYTAQLQLRLGKLRDARKSFTTLISRGDGPADERLLQLAEVLGQEDPEKADKLMRELAKPYPDSAYAQYGVAILALQAGDTKYAAKQAQRAIDLEPDWIKPKLLYSRTLMIDGHTDEAIDYTAHLIGDNPDADPDARMELALQYLAAKRDDDALSQVNQVLLEHAGRADALRLMAIINFQEENYDAAWDDFQDLLASRQFTMDALFYLGRIADQRKDYDQAIRLYSEVRGGSNALFAQQRASSLIAIEKHDPEKAITLLDEYARENPAHAIDALGSKAALLTQIKRYPQALALYDEVLSYRPDAEGVALGRAELLLRMDRLDDAIDEYRGALKRWPDSALAMNALGYTLADRTDQYREAEKLIRKALKLDPENPAIIDSLGWVLYKRNDLDESLTELRKAYKLYDDPEVAAHLVEVLNASGKQAEALQILAAAEQKKPGDEMLKGVRERVLADNPK